MRIEQRLEISDVPWPIVSAKVALGLNHFGVGEFIVRSPEGAEGPPSIKSAARVWIGYGGGTLFPLLWGYVADARPAEPGSWRVQVRELSAVLETPANLSLRHVTPLDVLAALTGACGETFATLKSATYLLERLPYWTSTGTCRAALDAMGHAWGLADAVWYQQPDGRVWWGRWADSPFNTPDGALVLTSDLVLAWDTAARTLEIPALPPLRPGAPLMVGDLEFIVRRMTWEGERMRLEWEAV